MVYFPEGLFKHILEYCDTQEREEKYAKEQHKKLWAGMNPVCQPYIDGQRKNDGIILRGDELSTIRYVYYETDCVLTPHLDDDEGKEIIIQSTSVVYK